MGEGEHMSKVSEMAKAEAAKAEAEPQDDNNDSDPDAPPAEDAPATPESEPDNGEPTPDDVKALNAEYARHENELHKIMGADFALLTECEFCGGMGYGPPVEFKANEKYKACDTCSGMGDVRTGSRKVGNELQPCPACGGRGFLERMPEQPAAPPVVNGETQPQPQYGVPSWMGNPDVAPAAVFPPPAT